MANFKKGIFYDNTVAILCRTVQQFIDIWVESNLINSEVEDTSDDRITDLVNQAKGLWTSYKENSVLYPCDMTYSSLEYFKKVIDDYKLIDYDDCLQTCFNRNDLCKLHKLTYSKMVSQSHHTEDEWRLMKWVDELSTGIDGNMYQDLIFKVLKQSGDTVRISPINSLANPSFGAFNVFEKHLERYYSG